MAELCMGAGHGVGAGQGGVLCTAWVLGSSGTALAPNAGESKHQGCPGGTRPLLAPGRHWLGPLRVPVQPVVPDAGIQQELVNHIGKRCRKWDLKNDQESCPGNAEPCPRTVLASPWCTPVLPIWPLLNPR